MKQYKEHLELMEKTLLDTNLEDKEVYANFLAQTYYYVRYSTRMLAAAAANMSFEDNKHYKRFIDHISEESFHEKLAESDLKKLGKSLSTYKELPETSMLWETQFYKIDHKDPLSLMGYIIALEYFAVIAFPKVLEKLTTQYGTATSFVKLHAEEDVDHIKKAIDLLADLSEDRKKAIYENVEQTAVAYSNMLKAL